MYDSDDDAGCGTRGGTKRIHKRASLYLNAGTMEDEDGNPALPNLNNIGTTENVRVDAVNPSVTSVSVPSNGVYRAEQDLLFTVSYNEAVYVTGTPRIALTIDSGTVYAIYDSGSGTNSLRFRYTVEPGLTDTVGIAANALDLNGGTIKDMAGNNAALTLNNIPDTSGIRVDSIAPAAPTIMLQAASDSGISSSDGVTNVSAPIITGLAEAGSQVTLSKDGTVIGTAVANGSGVWSVKTSSLSDGVHTFTATATDSAGNTGEVSSPLVITVDTAAPVLSVSPADGATGIATSGSIVLSFNEAMDHTGGTVQLGGASVTGTWNTSNTVYTIPYSGLSADETYALDIAGFRDIAGNEISSTSLNFSTETAVTYTIAASAGPGGSISPSGSVVVSEGSSRTFTITPDKDYRIVSVVVDGSDQGAVSSYTFTDVRSDHMITVLFAGIYVEDKFIVDEDEQITVDLTKGSSILSEEQVKQLISANSEYPVVLTGDGYEITFPAGTLTSEWTGDLDLGIRFNEGQYYMVIKEAAGDDFVLMLDFNHSGALPGEAQVRIFVGLQYAGKTLGYHYFNPQTGRLEYLQTVTVDPEGYVTVRQSHCSSYALTVYETPGPGADPEDEIPGTGDSSAPWLWWLLCILSLTGAAVLIMLNTHRKIC